MLFARTLECALIISYMLLKVSRIWKRCKREVKCRSKGDIGVALSFLQVDSHAFQHLQCQIRQGFLRRVPLLQQRSKRKMSCQKSSLPFPVTFNKIQKKHHKVIPSSKFLAAKRKIKILCLHLEKSQSLIKRMWIKYKYLRLKTRTTRSHQYKMRRSRR